MKLCVGGARDHPLHISERVSRPDASRAFGETGQIGPIFSAFRQRTSSIKALRMLAIPPALAGIRVQEHAAPGRRSSTLRGFETGERKQHLEKIDKNWDVRPFGKTF
jgi:hypothetical protein